MPWRSPGGWVSQYALQVPGLHPRGSLRGLARGGSPDPHLGGPPGQHPGGFPGPHLGGESPGLHPGKKGLVYPSMH